MLLIAGGAIAGHDWLNADESARTVLCCVLVCGGSLWLYFRFSSLYAVLIALLAMPVLVLAFGIMKRRRAFIDTGLLISLITVVVNKDYLGLKHYAWDPAILGILLLGTALASLRLLKNSKQGFTSEDLLKPEGHGIDLAVIAAFAAPSAESPGPADPFSGGQSGGAGASRKY